MTRARIVFPVIDAAPQATTMGLAVAAFRVCGLFPCASTPVRESRYICASEEDPEMEERMLHPDRHSTGSQILTSAEFISSLESRGRAAELEIDIAGVIPDDGDFVNEVVPDVVLRETVGETGEDGPTL